MTESGFWLSKRGVWHSMRECKYHGMQEYSWNTKQASRIAIGQTGLLPQCLECARQYRRGVRRTTTPGCSRYVGIYIAERVLEKAFKVMERANARDPYDFVCGRGLKVDSKCSCLSTGNRTWHFWIGQNKVPDTFCLIALNNDTKTITIHNAMPIHVWLIPGTAVVRGKAFNDMTAFAVNPRNIGDLNPYRRTDMEGRIIACCAHEQETE